MAGTFTVNRIELKRMLTMLGVSERSIDDLVADMNKMHRHVNAIAFAGMLQKIGVKGVDVANVLRRIGLDDVTITSIFNMLEEQRIKNAYGKAVDLSIE